ncbi:MULTISPECIES: glycoside hydrolase family 13 protein [Enterococcus]|uniref:Neopullulanase n=1 Tax=Enterococcus sulfureus ATCC 49903 TaxID=1140003 RepID=S0KZJ4_9ENTE|nr:glycoside hydrolase family 13 protein [Enterococcus sulfureus]EOT45513.1 neopullulanase [Enterococcus sulfureus ATCC 49903]EOT83404.1 neopullulanase [Enterococcus sulfureus ATCC 49903]
MNTAAIYHRPESEYAYLYKKDHMHIRLRTAKGDMKHVYLISGDPYLLDKEAWYNEREEMKKIGSTSLYDYWFIEKTAPFHRLSYGFEVEGVEGIKAFYGDHGVYAATEPFISMPNNYFRLPYFHEIDRVKPIEWVKETVWYQIFPERFANGDHTNDPDGTLPWGSKNPDRDDFFGGDLQGIIDHLDYLEDLGINGLYLCPIFKAHSNHKYDTIDYLKVDPAFGDEATLKELIAKCHERGIKIMLDAVFNHIGDTSPQWQDVLENGANSKYAKWFHIHEFPATYTPGDHDEDARDLTYDVFAFTPHMPKLNTANPEVQAYLLNIATYWIKEFDIDAWRLDVANEVDHAFWKKFREACTAVKDDFYILGEIWHSSQSWLQGDEFSAVMNYAYTDSIKDYMIEHTIDSTKLVSELTDQLMLYRSQINQMQFNVLDSHDTPRILTETRGDKDLMRQVMAFTYLQPGVPCIYYGDEIGMTGEMDPDCRKCMVWDEQEQDLALKEFVKQLIALRKTHIPTLSEGSLVWQIDEACEDHLCLIRRNQGTIIKSYFNCGTTAKTISQTEILMQNLAYEKEGTIMIEPKGFVVTVEEEASDE